MPAHDIAPLVRSICGIRGEKVILDTAPGAGCHVRPSALNQAVRRNPARFPGDFAFVLTPEEKPRWSQIVITSAG